MGQLEVCIRGNIPQSYFAMFTLFVAIDHLHYTIVNCMVYSIVIISINV